MAEKTFTTTVTLHVPGAAHKAFEFDAAGSRLSGAYHAEAVPPGTKVTLDEKEADAILKRFGGAVINKDGSKTEVDPLSAHLPKVTGDIGKPGGPKA